MATGTLVGGSGDDIFVIETTDFIIQDPGGNDTIQTTLNTFSLPITFGLNDIENLQFTGTGGFTGNGNFVANQIIGGTGNDTFFKVEPEPAPSSVAAGMIASWVANFAL